MSEHTPGPWAVERGPDGYEIVSRSPHLSASVAGISARHSPTGDADARLIAAAPELLAALIGMVELHDNLKTKGVLPADYGIAAGKAHAAIAKAEGRA
jgi:hypothetical protein